MDPRTLAIVVAGGSTLLLVMAVVAVLAWPRLREQMRRHREARDEARFHAILQQETAMLKRRKTNPK